ncbi:MAG: hypothetical protein AAB309_03140 [Deltaproteobacteria bacterium]
MTPISPISAISNDELSQIEYLLTQSAMGNHLLFDMDQIRKVFYTPSPLGSHSDVVLDFKTMDQVRQLIENLLRQPTLMAKRAFIENLPESSRELVIRAYFNILDHTLMDKREYFH